MNPEQEFSNSRGAYVPASGDKRGPARVDRASGKPASGGTRTPQRPRHEPRPARGPRPTPGRSGARRRPLSSRPMRPPRGRQRVEHAPAPRARAASTPIPPPGADTVRIIPLGGVEEIGRNMTAVEIGNDIFILDAGFAFSEED